MQFLYNLRLSIRNLVKKPLFSGIVIFTIAIAIGTNTVIFSFIDALLITDLPFEEPDRLVQIYSLKGEEEGLLAYPEFLDMRHELNQVEDIAVYRGGGRYNLSGDDQDPEEVTTTFASHNLFRVLGVEPYLGNYWPETFDEKGTHTVMLTYEFWQRRFKGNPKVVNQSITFDGVPRYEVYGILPEGFSFPDRHEAFRAMAYSDRAVTNRNSRGSIGVARLKPGTSIEDFNKELEVFAKTMQERHLSTNAGVTFIAKPLKDMYIGGVKNYLLLLEVAAIFLLIIACANVSNLILSHVMRRNKEIALRKVLGATKWPIIQQFILESSILSLMGGLLGLFLSFFLNDVFRSLVGEYLPHWVTVNISYTVLAFTILISLLVGIATGLIPALSNLANTNFIQALKEGSGTTGSRRQNTLRKGLVIAEIAVSAILLVGSGLLAKSFYNLQQSDLGFKTENRLTFRIALSWYNYSDPERIRSFYEVSTQRISAIPGVEGVAVNSVLPLSDMVRTSTEAQTVFTIEGQSPVEQTENPYINVQRITPNYFDVMGIPIKEGSGFNEDDPVADRFKVLIDEQLAARIGGNPIGKRLKLGPADSEYPYFTIQGIIADVKHQSIIDENVPSLYVSILTNSEIDAYYVLKTSVPPMTLAERLKQTILSIDENQPTFEYLLMEDHISNESWQSRISSVLFLAIAIIGGLTAAIGLFSVMTFILGQRVKELAVRRVLGAKSSDIFKLVIWDVMKIAGIGILIGIAFSVIVLRPIDKFLYDVDLFYLPIYGLMILALILVSSIATLLPAWRATTINPAIALKNE